MKKIKATIINTTFLLVFVTCFIGLFAQNWLMFIVSGLGIILLSIIEARAHSVNQKRLSEDV